MMMNKFAASNRAAFVVLALVSALALFNDGANITDLFPSMTTIHFDEVNESQSDEVAWYNVSSLQTALGSGSDHTNNFSKEAPIVLRLVLLDQDSPSEAAAIVNAGESFIVSPQVEQAKYHSFHSSELLYLEDCTFLL